MKSNFLQDLMFFCILGIIISLTACEKDQGPIVKPVPLDTTKVISFKNDVQPIFDYHCASCHSGSMRVDLRPCCSYQMLTENYYVDTLNPRYSFLYLKLTGEAPPRMPLHGDPLEDYQMDLIYEWMKQGAKNN